MSCNINSEEAEKKLETVESLNNIGTCKENERRKERIRINKKVAQQSTTKLERMNWHADHGYILEYYAHVLIESI